MSPAFDLEGMKAKACPSKPLPDTCLLTVAPTSPTMLQFPFLCHCISSHLWYGYKTATQNVLQTYQNVGIQGQHYTSKWQYAKVFDYFFWSQLK